MRRLAPSLFAILALLLAAPALAGAAEPVFLQLKIQGADVKGDVTLKGAEGLIECLSYEQEVTIPLSQAVGSGMATGRRQYQPLRITKRIDQASPLILRAVTQGQVVEGSFRFYRVSKTSGTLQLFYTVDIRQARVTSVKQVSPDRLTPATASAPPTEEVAIAFNTIRWTFTEGGITHEDSAGAGR